VIRLEALPSYIQIEAGDSDDHSVLLGVEARCGVFSGATSCWVALDDIRRMCVQLISPVSGVGAKLLSESEGEFSLSVGVANGRGYFPVNFELANLVAPLGSMSGRMEVETSQIDELRKWLSRLLS
jgi:hypothetical protein